MTLPRCPTGPPEITCEVGDRDIDGKMNGKAVNAQATPDTPGLWVVREEMGIRGTQFGCGVSECGACSVHVNGSPTRSCVLPLARR